MPNIKALVVAGGGGGGFAYGGGGGGGGVLYDAAHTVSVGTYTVTVGASTPSQTIGNDSVFDTMTAKGGGRANANSVGGNGGSGGGGSANTFPTAGAGTAGQGNNGGIGGGGGSDGAGGGGGGANQVGGDRSFNKAGKGGDGISNSISGTATYYGGGGAGGTNTSSGSSDWNSGGLGGGGKSNYRALGDSGTPNTGGGGGGGSQGPGGTYTDGGAGGSGIVILSWTTSLFGTCSITGTGNTITTNGADSIATFIVSGNITFVAGGNPGSFFQLF